MTMAAPERPDLYDLIALTAEQDRTAFALLYRATSPRLFGAVSRIVVNSDAAEDVLQDVYVRVWHAAGSYDASRGSPMTWLISIGRNIAIDHRRRWIARGEHAIVDLDEDREDPIGTSSPDTVIALNQCLEAMEPIRRDMLLKAYVEGWSREELSHHFERTNSTVKSILRRALLFLRTCLTV